MVLFPLPSLRARLNLLWFNAVAELQELLPTIFNQLGTDNLQNLKQLAEQAGGAAPGGDDDDDDGAHPYASMVGRVASIYAHAYAIPPIIFALTTVTPGCPHPLVQTCPTSWRARTSRRRRSKWNEWRGLIGCCCCPWAGTDSNRTGSYYFDT